MEELNVNKIRLRFFEKTSQDQTAQISGLQAQVTALTTQVAMQREHIVLLEKLISMLEAREKEHHSDISKARLRAESNGRWMSDSGATVCPAFFS